MGECNLSLVILFNVHTKTEQTQLYYNSHNSFRVSDVATYTGLISDNSFLNYKSPIYTVATLHAHMNLFIQE